MTSYEKLLSCTSAKLEDLTGRRPPFGTKLKSQIEELPNFELGAEIRDGYINVLIAIKNNVPPKSRDRDIWYLIFAALDEIIHIQKINLRILLGATSPFSKRIKLGSIKGKISVHLGKR